MALSSLAWSYRYQVSLQAIQGLVEKAGLLIYVRVWCWRGHFLVPPYQLKCWEANPNRMIGATAPSPSLPSDVLSWKIDNVLDWLSSIKFDRYRDRYYTLHFPYRRLVSLDFEERKLMESNYFFLQRLISLNWVRYWRRWTIFADRAF